MTCSDELIQLYVDGALQPAEAAILDQHLKDCAACRRRLGLYKELFWDLAHAGRLTPSVDAESGTALADLLKAEWQRNQAERAGSPSWTGLATLWLTANPTVTVPARAAGQAGRAGMGLLMRRLRGGGDR